MCARGARFATVARYTPIYIYILWWQRARGQQLVGPESKLRAWLWRATFPTLSLLPLFLSYALYLYLSLSLSFTLCAVSWRCLCTLCPAIILQCRGARTMTIVRKRRDGSALFIFNTPGLCFDSEVIIAWAAHSSVSRLRVSLFVLPLLLLLLLLLLIYWWKYCKVSFSRLFFFSCWLKFHETNRSHVWNAAGEHTALCSGLWLFIKAEEFRDEYSFGVFWMKRIVEIVARNRILQFDTFWIRFLSF